MEISEKLVEFVQEHMNEDVVALRLKLFGKSHIPYDFPIDLALVQIEARRKTRKKLPSFLDDPLFIFPDIMAAEQASNEAVARFHASLVHSGTHMLDLTAGLGIDDLTFASRGIHVTACEINENKAEILVHNARKLGLHDQLTVLNTDSIDYVKTCEKKYDVVFSDPARRSNIGRRVHALSDCQPDILGGMTSIMKVTDRLLVKCSPLLDLSFIKATVDQLSHIYVVCLKGECKEVLIDIEKRKEFSGTTVVDLDMESTISRFDCHLSPIGSIHQVQSVDRKSAADYHYLYEPNSGVMKTGAWGELVMRFPDIRKVDANTHLFCSDTLYKDFPGRVTIITSVPDKKALKSLRGTKYNIVARNYPLSAPDFTRKYGLTPGGDRFLYAFRYQGKPVCVTTEPVC